MYFYLFLILGLWHAKMYNIENKREKNYLKSYHYTVIIMFFCLLVYFVDEWFYNIYFIKVQFSMKKYSVTDWCVGSTVAFSSYLYSLLKFCCCSFSCIVCLYCWDLFPVYLLSENIYVYVALPKFSLKSFFLYMDSAAGETNVLTSQPSSVYGLPNLPGMLTHRAVKVIYLSKHLE